MSIGGLGRNELVSGGLLLMGTGSIIALFRNVPLMILNKIRNQIMISVSIQERDPLFGWITLWLDRHPYSKKARSIRAITKENTEDNFPKIIFSPAKGEHLFFYQKKLVWLSRLEEEKGKKKTPDDDSHLKKEEYIFRMFGRKQNIIRKLLEDVLDCTKDEREERISIYTSPFGYWEKLYSYKTRPLDSVILPRGKKEELVNDVSDFLSSRQWYIDRGIPFRRGYLLYGPPGNGKTSLIAAISGELQLNLYSLNLSNRMLNDGILASLFRSARPRSILLLEDIDAAVKSRDQSSTPSIQPASPNEKNEGVTLSGLLNVLDGILTPDGLIVVMTTNYINRLDSALIRPGRVDRRVEFSYATDEQKLKSFQWFYPDRSIEDAVDFCGKFNGSTSMATIQQKLISMKEISLKKEHTLDAAN